MINISEIASDRAALIVHYPPIARITSFLERVTGTSPGQMTLSDGMRRPVSRRDAVGSQVIDVL
jgi:hypothetical protein